MQTVAGVGFNTKVGYEGFCQAMAPGPRTEDKVIVFSAADDQLKVFLVSLLRDEDYKYTFLGFTVPETGSCQNLKGMIDFTTGTGVFEYM